MKTEYEFEFPRGYRDGQGEIHKRGKMRLATAGDELVAARDPRVLNNPSYLTVVLLSRVVTEIEGLESVSVRVMEELYTADLAFLQDMYQKINDSEPPAVKAVCPNCGQEHEVRINFTRED